MDLHFNQSLALGYHSGSQISRVLTEDWMERNMFCPVCEKPRNTLIYKHLRIFNTSLTTYPLSPVTSLNFFPKHFVESKKKVIFALVKQT